MENFNNISSTFDLATQYFSDVEALEKIGTPTIQNALQIVQLINQINYITGGSNPQFTQLLNTSVGQAVNQMVENEVNTVIGYMQSITIQVEQPNNPGNYIPLYVGTSSVEDDGDGDDYFNQNFQDQGTDSDGDPIALPATLWEIVSNPNDNLMNNSGDAYFDNSGGSGPGLATNWSYSGSLQSNSIWDGSDTDNGEYSVYQGSVAAWLPYISFNMSNADTAGEQQSMVNFTNIFG